MSSFLIIFAEKRIAMPKISIILPIYNVAPYLDDAFQSLLNQTYSDFEIIAVNDGSTDNSQDYINKYMSIDSRISCYRQDNKGLSEARNTGMRHIKGEYVYFMDSDDILEVNALEKCYTYATTNNADVCLFDAKLLYEEGAKQIPWNYNREKFLEENKRYDGEALFAYLLRTGMHRAVVWLQFIRWSYLKQLHLDFHPGIIHEDELFTPQLFLQTNHIYYLNETFIKHRIRSTSIQGKSYSKRNINCYLTVIDELHRFQDSPIIRQFSRYTLSKVFYTGHIIPFRDKPGVFFRALKSGYLKYIGWKSCLVFWLK